MKTKLLKIGFVVLMLLVTVLSASAIESNIISWLQFEETSGTTADDYYENNDGTISGATLDQTGKVNKAYSFDGTNDKVTLTGFDGNFSNDIFSVAFWLYPTGFERYDGIIKYGSDPQSGTINYFEIGYDDRYGNGILYKLRTGSADYEYIRTDKALTLNAWNHIIMILDGKTFKVYVNGELGTNTVVLSAGSPSVSALTNLQDFKLMSGNNGATEMFIAGSIDEFGFWSREINSTEISELYNSGTGITPPFSEEPEPEGTPFLITAKNVVGDASIDEFCSTIDSVEKCTTNGTVHTGLNQSATTKTILITSDDFLSRTYTDQSISSNLQAELHQSEISFNASEMYTNNSLSNPIFYTEAITSSSNTGVTEVTLSTFTVAKSFSGLDNHLRNVEFQHKATGSSSTRRTTSYIRVTYSDDTTLNSSEYTTTSSDYVSVNFTHLNPHKKVKSVEILSKDDGVSGDGSYIQQSYVYFLTPIGTQPLKLNVGEYNYYATVEDYFLKPFSFNVTAKDQKTVTATGLYNAMVTINLRDVITEEVTAKNSSVTFVNETLFVDVTETNTNGTITAQLLKGNYTIDFFSLDYAPSNATINVENATNTFNYYLYANNSIWVTLYDTVSSSQLFNFSVELSSNDNIYTLNDSGTGTVRFNNVTSGVYVAKITKAGYTQPEYTITMTGGSHQSLIGYATSSAEEEIIFFITSVFGGAGITNATVNMYQIINSVWSLVSSQKTDITGRTKFGYVDNVEYKFEISHSSYETKEFTLKPLFTSYTITLVPLTSEERRVFYDDFTLNVNKQFVINNTSENVTVSASSPSGTFEYVLINVTGGGVSEVYNITNSYGGTHTFNLNINSATRTDNLIFNVTVKETGRATKEIIKIIPVFYGLDSTNVLDWGSLGAEMSHFEKNVIVTMVTLIITGVVSLGATAVGIPAIIPASIILLIFLFLFVIIDWISIYVILIVGFAVLLSLITNLKNN